MYDNQTSLQMQVYTVTDTEYGPLTKKAICKVLYEPGNQPYANIDMSGNLNDLAHEID